MNEEYKLENALCSKKEIEKAWNISQNPNNNNVYKNYIQNPKKNKQYKIMDMGAYCVLNDITSDVLKVFIENEKRLMEVILGNSKDAKKENNKLVIMTEKEYKDYETFKKFKVFSENQK